MRSLLIASAITIATFASAHASGLDELSRYEWKSRVVVLFGGSGDPKLAQQVEAQKAQEKQLADRDMVVFSVIGDEVRPVFGNSKGIDARKLRQEADIKSNAFQAVLVGKDGGIKLRSSDVVTDKALFGLVDQMPMRKNGQG